MLRLYRAPGKGPELVQNGRSPRWILVFISQEHDVTAGYVILDFERLKKASRKIEAEILHIRAEREAGNHE